jgi:hypothetical protein
LAYRLLGNAHEDVLTAFETYLKTVFKYLIKCNLPERANELTTKKHISTKCQNIDRARSLYEDLSVDPFGSLVEEDLEFLRINIGKRHVIGHNLSMADDAYADAFESAQPGRTVGLLGEEIKRFAEVCSAVIEDLEGHLALTAP